MELEEYIVLVILKMESNKGYEIDGAMMKWFKGKPHPYDCVDFQTNTSLYEVKGCNFLNRNPNGNHKRKYVDKPHKQIVSTRFGRFFIKNYNHIALKSAADKANKIPKYIFVLLIGKQKVFRVKSWEFVDNLITGNSNQCAVLIKDIFGDGII